MKKLSPIQFEEKLCLLSLALLCSFATPKIEIHVPPLDGISEFFKPKSFIQLHPPTLMRPPYCLSRPRLTSSHARVPHAPPCHPTFTTHAIDLLLFCYGDINKQWLLSYICWAPLLWNIDMKLLVNSSRSWFYSSFFLLLRPPK